MCGRRRDLQRATALLYINRLQPSLPSRCSSVLEHPLQRALRATDPRLSVRSTFRAAVLLFSPIPGVTVAAAGLAWKEHCSTFSHHHTLTPLLLCHERQPSAAPTGQSQKQVNTTLQPGNRAGEAGPTTETEPGKALLFLLPPHLGTTTQMPKPACHCRPGLVLE